MTIQPTESRLEMAGQPMLAAAVLCGGASVRMGFPKALLAVDGTVMINQHVKACHASGLTALVCADQLDFSSLIEGPFIKVRDSISQQGPLAAIAGAMNYCHDHDIARDIAPDIAKAEFDKCWLAVVSVDSLVDVSALLTWVPESGALVGDLAVADIVCLQDAAEKRVYPLLGWYRLGLREALQGFLADGQRRVMDFIGQQTLVTLPVPADWRYQLNINDQAAYQTMLSARMK